MWGDILPGINIRKHIETKRGSCRRYRWKSSEFLNKLLLEAMEHVITVLDVNKFWSNVLETLLANI